MKKIVAPCGIDCFNCEMFEDNVTEEFQSYLAEKMKISKELITCKGCIEGNICLLLSLQGKRCKTADCAREKGVDYCFECNTFPCENIMPVADEAQKVPHNIKLYNLCRMKRMGIDAWTEEAAEIRKIYFNKKFGIGEGGNSN
jgi:hypothetical protein